MTRNRFQLFCWSMMVVATAGAPALLRLPREAPLSGVVVTPGDSFPNTSTPASPTTSLLNAHLPNLTSTVPTAENWTILSPTDPNISEKTTTDASTTTEYISQPSTLTPSLSKLSTPTPSTPALASTTGPSNSEQVTPSLIEELRRKRNPSQTVPIMHAEEIGMCKFVVQEDSDPERTPQTIYTVTCRQAGCRCGTEGDYRCTQLTSEVRVTYRNGAKNQVLYPNSGCICAAKEASDALSGAPQITV